MSEVLPPLTIAPARPAAAVVLWRRGPAGLEVFWVRRGDQLKFAGGFYAFPGGRVDDTDALVPVRHLASPDDRALIASAARELFEETGVLAAPGASRVPLGQRKAMRERLLARPPKGALTPTTSVFGDFLALHELFVDARLFSLCGRWITPTPLPARFDARFYLAELPAGELAEVWPGELADGEWTTPARALDHWESGRALLHPPAWHTLKVLELPATQEDPRSQLALFNDPQGAPWRLPMDGHVVKRMEFQRGVWMVPLRSPTLPPATHTNCMLLGDDELFIVDPGSPWASEQALLDEALADLATQGKRPKGILLTHHHYDHVAGAMPLSARLGLPIAAHKDTAALLAGEVRVDRLLLDGERLGVSKRDWQLLHLPGHTQGHVCLMQDESHAVIAGDLVAGTGTVVIDPPEGDMHAYLRSLHRLLDLAPRTLYPAHGPVVAGGAHLLQGYIAHRLERENKVVAALEQHQGGTPEELVPAAYPDVSPVLYPLAARSLLAHLLKLVEDKRVKQTGARFELL